MFVGAYYPRHRQTELCGVNSEWSGAFIGGRWIGNGAKTGAETAACLMAAQPIEADGGDSLYGCVVDSCPGISAPMSEAARCLASKGLGQCEAQCEASLAACNACIGQTCGLAVQAVAAAPCQ